jgi:predicted AAA+ superfamily ATPase
VLDELHKRPAWKDWLKGLFDAWERQVHIVVSGSARLGIFRSGGDSLVGRYFPYRMHQLSLAELLQPAPRTAAIGPPLADRLDELHALVRWGGFPEPLERASTRFWNRWRRARTMQLLRDDLRDLTRVHDVAQVQLLAEAVRRTVGTTTSYTWFARQVSASVDSARRWLEVLGALYHVFPVHPWYHNVPRSLRKEPKWYLWDWSHVPGSGPAAENLVACALLKAVHFWTDHGLGDYRLWFIRDKQKREVDFLVSRDGEPWFLVEVKTSGGASLSPALGIFQRVTGASHAFQVAMDLEPVSRDCFAETRPVIVPAATFLSQLV